LDIFAFFASVHCVFDRPSDYRKSQTFYVVYGGILLALTTIGVAMDALGGQYMWIDHRNYPGGPPRYFVATRAAWFNVLGQGAAAATTILGDGLLVRLILLLRRRGEFVTNAMADRCTDATSSGTPDGTLSRFRH